MTFASHSMKTLFLAGLVAISMPLLAEEPSTASGEKKHEMPKLPEATERSFGFFSPLDVKAPPSIGSGIQPGPMLPMPVLPPRLAPKPDEKAAEKKDWIFAKPENESPEAIFGVKTFTDADKGKTLTPMEKFLLDD